MKTTTRRAVIAALSTLTALAPGRPLRAADRLRIAVTTTFENSGLAAHILPRIEAATEIAPQLVVVGTGQAHHLARRGDIDLLITHAPEQERALVTDGAVVDRQPLMANDFVIVGPRDDPAGLRRMSDPDDALRAIRDAGAAFVSRGDQSGTHVRERALWRAAGIDPDSLSSGWYRKAGAGMGAALNIAAALGAYAFTDSGTWIAFRNRSTLDLLFEAEPPIENPYAIMIVNPARHTHVCAESARLVAEWLTGPKGQDAITAFQIDDEQVFYPTARRQMP